MRQRGQKWRTWEMAGLFAALLLGNTLHFVYDWTGQARWAAYLAATNESTWEHMKLLFVPLLLVALAAAIFGGHCRGYWTAKLAGALVGLLLIPMLYYGYTESLGVHVTWVDIGIFFVAAAVAFLLESHLTKHLPMRSSALQAVAAALFAALAVLFVWFTYAPPHLPIFLDPITGTYGI